MRRLIYLFLVLVFIFAACGKKSETKKEESTKDKQKEEQAEKEKRRQDSLNVLKEQADREKTVKEALDEDKILKDTLGQWAVNAEASSSYGNNTGRENWSPAQMTGAPDVEKYADDGRAWTSYEAEKGIEWVLLTYGKAVNATEVRVRQTYNPGAIIKIELIDDKGKNHTVWEGIDKTKYEPEKIQYFIAKFEKTEFKTQKVKITLAMNSIDGWKEIDAVQLVGN